MSSDTIAIRASGLGKCYHIYDTPRDRLKQFILPHFSKLAGREAEPYFKEFWALKEVSFEIEKGEVLGIIGRNGAGKSTLLQILCGTLSPSHGSVETYGRVAALLELGAGFNPEFTGRENVYLNACVLGLRTEEIDARFDDIVAFADIGLFIDQPVKTYSSGMFVRLAFSIATSVDPDILVIDEALSVGDGAFARKSFDRIMALKDAGKTILFCSHSMYQIDVLCKRALWLERGRLHKLETATSVTSAYNTALALESAPLIAPADRNHPAAGAIQGSRMAPASTGRILAVHGHCDQTSGPCLQVQSQVSTLSITVEFLLDPQLPQPSVALGIENAAGMAVSSVISTHDGATLKVDAQGRGQATVVFPQIPLMKGKYQIGAFLACEKGLHVYDFAAQCLTLEVTQEGAAQGVAVLPHRWTGGIDAE